MPTTLHSTPGSYTSVLTTELNALANSTSVSTGISAQATTAIDNSSALMLYADFTLILAAQGGNRAAGAYCELYFALAPDGSTYDTSLATYIAPAVVWNLNDAVSTAVQLTIPNVQLPVGLIKPYLLNKTGQALAATTNLVKYRTHSIAS